MLLNEGRRSKVFTEVHGTVTDGGSWSGKRLASVGLP